MPRSLDAPKAGRPPGDTTEFARGTKALSPDTLAVLKGIWHSGKYASKEEMAEAVGLDYDTVRHIASREKWATEVALRREITDATLAAVRAFRDAHLAKFMEGAFAQLRDVGEIVKDALARFQQDGALVGVDSTGQQTLSQHRVQDVRALVATVDKLVDAQAKLLGLDSLRKTLDADKGDVKINAPNSRIQLNHLVKQ